MPARPATPCPRCDYDLSGTFDSWIESCPLDGRCPECGLDIRWAELLNPALTYPKWSFEHADHRLLSRLASSLVRTLWPWHFWRAIRMEHPIHANRVVHMVLTSLLGVHLASAVLRGCWEANLLFSAPWPTGSNPSGPQLREFAITVLWPYDSLPYRASSPWQHPVFAFLLLLLIPLGCSLIFLCIGDTLVRCAVSSRHVFRVAGYSVAALAMMLGLLGVLLAGMAVAQPFTPRRDLSFLGFLVLGGQFLGTPVFALWFWWAACKRYLRIPHAFAVALAAVVLSILSIMSVLLVIGFALA